MNDNEYTTVEDRQYINPEIGLSESQTFIDNLRAAQEAENAKIASDTHALGTDVPSRMGGLGGSEGTFVERYQTPRVNKMISDLRAVAQAQAMNERLSNVLAQEKERYNRAYKANQARMRAAQNTPVSTPGTSQPDVEVKSPDKYRTEETVTSNAPGTTTLWSGKTDEFGNPIMTVYDDPYFTGGTGPATIIRDYGTSSQGARLAAMSAPQSGGGGR